MTDSAPASGFRWQKVLPWVVVALGTAAYINTLPNEFIFDDTAYLAGQVRIERWSDVWAILSGSRGVPNLTFAINRLLDGEEPRGYHLVNMLIHLGAGLALFGIVRRASGVAARFPLIEPAGSWLAFAVAVLWVVHPLNTQAVTYVIQRHESMMGLFYLLTLYAVFGLAEAQVADRRRAAVAWGLGAVLACAAGMASKQVMVTAPVVALLCDRTLLAGTFRDAFRRRGWLYALLALTWLIALRDVLAATAADPEASAGFSFAAFTWWQYLLSQGEVILWYLRLAVWPWPLVLDYGWLPAARMAEHQPSLWVTRVGIPVAVVVALLGLCVYGLVRNRVWGLLGFAAFAILSVSSSVIPIADLAVEHRMYLSLAPLIALGVLGVWCGLGRIVPSHRTGLAAVLLGGLIGAWGVVTVVRNAEYRTGVSLWTTVVERAPHNPRAWHNLGEAYGTAGEPEVAIRLYERAIDLVPTFADARHNLGQMWLDVGRPAEAEEQFREAIKYGPGDAEPHVGLAGALLAQNRPAEAEAAAREALRLDPDHARAQNNLGVALAKQGRGDGAIASFRAAIEADAELLDAYRNLVQELLRAGRIGEAADVAEANVAAAERAGVDPRVVGQIRAGAAQLRAQVERAE